MKQLVWVWAIWVMLCSAGCSPSVEQGYAIMFDGPVSLFDTGVYYQGARIGKVFSTVNHPAGTVQLKVTIDSGYQKLMASNAAFYADNGRLCYSQLANFGQPLGNDGRWLGFHSKAALNWFKFRHFMADPTDAAARRAGALAELNH